MTDARRPAAASSLERFLERALRSRAPSPLASTEITLDIEAGLVVAALRRVFRNVEDRPIEATLTFPIPVDATLFGLSAEIGGRRLTAVAAPRATARAAYDAAIEKGATAVLHEELLRGAHLMSIGAIAPGAEAAVTARWAAPLSMVGGAARLIVPMTIGDIYGAWPSAADGAPTHAQSDETATLRLGRVDGAARLDGRLLTPEALAAPIAAPLDRPIVLTLDRWAPRALTGRAADGRTVAITLAPRESEDLPLDLAILVDRSGSMGAADSADDPQISKHAAAIAGLRRLAERLMTGDRVDLWQFGHDVDLLGPSPADAAPRAALSRQIDRLDAPAGGTEIGRAVGAALAQSSARDVLLLTDGKSHALDVQTLAQAGRRVSVVLVGEDSFEANVGRLASLTGGEIFVAGGGALAETLLSAAEALRSEAAPRPRITGAPTAASRVRGGVLIEAAWRAEGGGAVDPKGRAVAAMAASLALPAMETEAAEELAVAEGLVTHLSSLVLVDGTATESAGPMVRRVAPLATPATAGADRFDDIDCAPPERAFRLMETSCATIAAPRLTDAEALALSVPWSLRANAALADGDLSALAPETAARVRRFAEDPEIVAAAGALSRRPVVVALMVLAYWAASARPEAARFLTRLSAGEAAETLMALSHRFRG